MSPANRLLLAVLITTALAAATASGQAPAPAAPAAAAGAARGGRGGAGGGAPALTPAQQTAVSREVVSPTATAARTAAFNALNRASVTLPFNQADIEAKAAELAVAELALAAERAEAFARIQASLKPLTPAQAAASVGAATGANWEAAYRDRTGFTALFDGRTLDGWDREGDAWEVVDGMIHHLNTPQNVNLFGQHHIFYVGSAAGGPLFGDFDLRVEYKIRAGNAGIHFRSRLESGTRAQDGEPPRAAGGGGRGGAPANELAKQRNVAAAIADPIGKPLPPGIKTLKDAWAAKLIPDGVGGDGVPNPWQISGYQYDITTGGSGSLYEGQGRGTIGGAGEMFIMVPGTPNKITLGRVADNPWQQWGKPGDFNQVQIIARGNLIVYVLNGHIALVAIDEDPDRRAMKGLISLQLENPNDAEIWYRNVYIKPL